MTYFKPCDHRLGPACTDIHQHWEPWQDLAFLSKSRWREKVGEIDGGLVSAHGELVDLHGRVVCPGFGESEG